MGIDDDSASVVVVEVEAPGARISLKIELAPVSGNIPSMRLPENGRGGRDIEACSDEMQMSVSPPSYFGEPTTRDLQPRPLRDPCDGESFD